jgi:hypothetical protein
MGANVHMSSDINMFSSYEVARYSYILMGNGSHATIHCISMVDLKFTLIKIVQLKNMHDVATMNKNIVSSSLLCKERFRVVLRAIVVCNQSNLKKPHKAVEGRHLSPLDFIHYNLCEMNGVLT